MRRRGPNDAVAPDSDAIAARLDPPGAGLPAPERWLLRHVAVPLLGSTTTWEEASRSFMNEARRILLLGEALDAPRLTQRVLVARPFGIEDSSRAWSVAMTMEHLIVVGTAIAHIAVALGSGADAGADVAIADFKPAGNLGARAPDAFRAFADEYVRRMDEDVADRRSRRRHVHPWFGPLTPHQWHCVAAAHQALHRRQVQRIVAGLRG